MRILAIETSCDETAIAIVETEGELPSITLRVLADDPALSARLAAALTGVNRPAKPVFANAAR